MRAPVMPLPIARVAVFCGSNAGHDNAYEAAARELGAGLVERKFSIVYGGTHKGLMGVVADAALDAGGTVHGVITERLRDKGHLHPRLSSWEVMPTMRARKARMVAQADAFIALPGGIGTLEELLEAWTLNQLGEIRKPVGLFDVNGYFQPFMAMVDHMIDKGFLPPSHREGIVCTAKFSDLVYGIVFNKPITAPKWMS